MMICDYFKRVRIDMKDLPGIQPDQDRDFESLRILLFYNFE
jgi:hypothetical protein